MKSSVTLENQQFDKIDEGLFRAKAPYIIDVSSWMYDREHVGYQAITSPADEDARAIILYISTTGSASMKLIGIYNDLREKGEQVGFIEGVPEINAMGELYV